MTSDIHALSGAYAIDALDDIERAQFERHLAECAECRAEVDGLREAAGLLAETSAAEPPAALRERLLAEVATVRPLPPVTPPPAQHTGRSRRRWVAPLVAAAAVVAALGAGGVVWHPWSDETTQAPPVSAADRVRNAPDAVSVTRRVDGGEATIVASKSLNQFVVSTEGLPALPVGKVYEMWLQDADEGMVPVSGGLMTAADSTVVLEGDLANALGAGITVEPAGGSRVPTSDPVAVFSFETA
ncbi:anti-sigma factor [Nocardioides koreensis]|uniref:Regulator of SigK n=1 Tax=Nocardioides koreensis TaxID=433651 RepID=A0ABN2ZXS5_9ACTN